jgi:uncharacterized membrane protein
MAREGTFARGLNWIGREISRLIHVNGAIGTLINNGQAYSIMQGKNWKQDQSDVVIRKGDDLFRGEFGVALSKIQKEFLTLVNTNSGLAPFKNYNFVAIKGLKR